MGILIIIIVGEEKKIKIKIKWGDEKEEAAENTWNVENENVFILK